jgi:hypothetical protein
LSTFSTHKKNKNIVIPGGYPVGMTGKNDNGHLERTNFINLFSETPAATLRLLRHSATRFYLLVLEAQQQTLPDKVVGKSSSLAEGAGRS